MRCRGCNKILSDVELKVRNKHTGEFEDLCGDCRYMSHAEETPLEDLGVVITEEDK